MLRSSMIYRVSALALMVGALLLTASQVSAFKTGGKWSGRAWAFYRIDPQLEAKLPRERRADGSYVYGVPGAIAEVRRAEQYWDDSTVFTFKEDYWDNPRELSYPVTAFDFRAPNDCSITNTTAAVVCTTQDGRTLYRVEMYLNTSGRYLWNTQEIIDSTRRDVRATSTHEFGHWIFLDD